MIYTVTLNPSIDYIVRLKDFREGLVNRTSTEELLYGGKGINTSVVLTNIGIENIALGFVGGNTGEEFVRILSKDNVKTDFVKIKNGITRINIKIKAQKETEINALGPTVAEDELSELKKKLYNLKEGDYVTLAGSIPSSLPQNLYVEFAEFLEKNKINIVVDAEKKLLTEVLPYRPFLVKPNHHELGAIFNEEVTSKEDAALLARKLQKMGARNVFVSMAGDGGVFVSESGEGYFSPAPSGKVINSTGAGDSLVAGFLAEYSRSNNYKKAFIYGLCAGSASAFSSKLATKNEIDTLYNNFDFNKIESI